MAMFASPRLWTPPARLVRTTHHRAAHSLVQSSFLCRAGMYSGTCVGTAGTTVLGFPFFNYYPPSRGASDPSPVEPLDAPRSRSRSSAPILPPRPQRGAICGGRGTVVVPRGVGWRSGVAAVFWVCCSKNVFKDPFGHHYYYRGASYNDILRSSTSSASQKTDFVSESSIVTIFTTWDLKVGSADPDTTLHIHKKNSVRKILRIVFFRLDFAEISAKTPKHQLFHTKFL